MYWRLDFVIDGDYCNGASKKMGTLIMVLKTRVEYIFIRLMLSHGQYAEPDRRL